MQNFLILFISGIALIQAQDSFDPYSGPGFKSLVLKSDPLSVNESLKAFKVPVGFKMELVASRLDIGQPMNLAFDESIIFASVDGKETTLQKIQIKLQRKLPLSIMPTGFAHSIPKGEFSNLIEYLLTKR